jgi:opacity protein-like surface antigen
MDAIFSSGGNRWNILGFNFTKRDALSSVYKISMDLTMQEQLRKM